jgi:hypothetical protein
VTRADGNRRSAVGSQAPAAGRRRRRPRIVQELLMRIGYVVLDVSETDPEVRWFAVTL